MNPQKFDINHFRRRGLPEDKIPPIRDGRFVLPSEMDSDACATQKTKIVSETAQTLSLVKATPIQQGAASRPSGVKAAAKAAVVAAKVAAVAAETRATSSRSSRRRPKLALTPKAEQKARPPKRKRMFGSDRPLDEMRAPAASSDSWSTIVRPPGRTVYEVRICHPKKGRRNDDCWRTVFLKAGSRT